MRLLIINTNPVGSDGVTNVIRNLFSKMNKAELQTDIVVVNEPNESFRKMFEDENGKVFIVPRSTKHSFRYIFELKKIIKNGKYDVIHAHGNSATMALEMLAAWLAGCKVRIGHSHNTTCVYKRAHHLLKPLFLLLCTHRLACGEEAGRWLFGKKPFWVVKNGVDTMRFAFSSSARALIRHQYGIDEGQKLIVHVGLFFKRKNQSFIVDMMPHLSHSYKLMLIGEGDTLPIVLNKAAEMGLQDRVIFVGVTDRVEDYLSASDLAVMASLYEGLPLTLVEQQTSGLPCISSENITREVNITGEVKFLSLDLGAEAWADAVTALTLPENREDASAQAIEKIKANGYDIYAEAEKLRQYYFDAVEKAKRK